MKKMPVSKAAVRPPKRPAPPKPLSKPFAVVATRLVGEYATRAEAERVQERTFRSSPPEEWVTLLSNPAKKEKKR